MVDWIDSPVTLPPGCARLVTRPPPIGSGPNGKTMGMIAVACLMGTAVAFVTMTSTLRRINSAAISVLRWGVPEPAILERDGATLDPAEFA